MKRTLLALALVAFATTASAQEPLAGTLKKIRDSKTITVGHRIDSIPFSFVGQDKQPTGYTIDLCKRIVASIQRDLKLPDINVKWVPVTAESRIPAVVKGEVDLECGTTTATLSRMEQVDFSNLVFVDGASLITRTETGIKRFADLGGKKIGVTAGTTTEARLRGVLKDRLINAEVVPVKGEADAIAALESGKLDAYANDRIVLIGLAVKAKDASKLFLLEEDFSIEPYGLMMRRNDSAFRLAVNRGLSQVYRSGAIGEIYGRWFGAFGQPSPALAALFFLNATPE